MSDRYPNIEAIAAGCVAGNFREWPMVRHEAKRLLAERDELLAALRDIANPLTKLREQAQEAGCVLDGAMVVQLVNDPHWLREKAKAAVAAAERLAGDKTE